MEEKLQNLHDHINDLLKYAEAKNGLLIGFNSLVLVEIVEKVFSQMKCLPLWAVLGFSYLGLCNIISLLISLFSFLPSFQTEITEHKFRNRSNYLFYGTIATLSPAEFFEQFKQRYKLEPTSETYCLDMIRQIIIQSQILIQKFNRFSLASLFTICSFISPLGFLLFKWIHRDHVLNEE